jgi:hypothetical protein
MAWRTGLRMSHIVAFIMLTVLSSANHSVKLWPIRLHEVKVTNVFHTHTHTQTHTHEVPPTSEGTPVTCVRIATDAHFALQIAVQHCSHKKKRTKLMHSAISHRPGAFQRSRKCVTCVPKGLGRTGRDEDEEGRR